MFAENASDNILNLLWHSIWADNTLPGKTIVLIVIAVLIVSTLAARKHIRRYKRVEAPSLDVLEEKLRRWYAEHADEKRTGVDEPADGELSALRDMDETDYKGIELADIAHLKRGLDTSSLIYERLDAIERMRARQVRVDVDSLQQLSLARENSRRGMTTAGYASGLAIMLGLLGTFAGLTMVVQRIDFKLPQELANVSMSTWVNSIKNIREILGGMKTAFSASMVGLVCSIWCSLLNYSLKHRQSTFFERLESFTTKDLLPATVPAVEEEDILLRVTSQLEKAFTRLDDIFEQNKETLKDMTGAEEAFLSIVQEVRSITKNEASRNLDGVINELVTTNRSIVSLVGHLSKITEVATNGQRELQQRIENALGASPQSYMPPREDAREHKDSLRSPLIVLAGIFAIYVLAKLIGLF